MSIWAEIRGETMGEGERQVGVSKVLKKPCFWNLALLWVLLPVCDNRTFPGFRGAGLWWVIRCALSYTLSWVADGCRTLGAPWELQAQDTACSCWRCLGRWGWPPRSVPHRTEGLFCHDYLITRQTNKKKKKSHRAGFQEQNYFSCLWK